MGAVSGLDETISVMFFGRGVPVAQWLTLLGEPQLALPLTALVLAWLLGGAELRRRAPAILWSGALLLLLVQGTKTLVDRPRPGAQLAAVRSLPGGSLRRRALPSGHSAQAAWAGGLIAAASSGGPLIAVAALGLAVSVGWSRLALGAHWFFDVLAGLFLGFGLAFAASKRQERERPDPESSR